MRSAILGVRAPSHPYGVISFLCTLTGISYLHLTTEDTKIGCVGGPACFQNLVVSKVPQEKSRMGTQEDEVIPDTEYFTSDAGVRSIDTV